MLRLNYGRIMLSIRRTLPVAVALTFVAASCGGSSDGSTEDAEPAETAAEAVEETGEDLTEAEGTEDEPVEEAATDEEPVEEAPVEETEEAEEPEAETDSGEAAADGIEASLTEWTITAPTEYAAGEITFNASNGGSFPHELVVIQGESYESLPLAEGGAVIEDDLPTGALIGRTGRLGGGSSEALTVTLAPGNYVLVCNLGGGTNSHAGQGQRLDITVS